MLLKIYSLCLYECMVLFFFFKQKTAYELRISDLSSDVCSSDLEGTCDQDSTYNTSNVVGDRDVFNLGTLDFNPNKIYAVVLTLIARKEDVATRRVKAFIQNGLVESPSEDMYLTTNYTILPTIFET